MLEEAGRSSKFDGFWRGHSTGLIHGVNPAQADRLVESGGEVFPMKTDVAWAGNKGAEGVPVVMRITMNWNPSYSYAEIPMSETNYPAYWKVLATPVPEGKGRAHFHDVHIWNVKATGAKTAFEVDVFPEVPVDHFILDHWDIEARTAGHISDAKDWKFMDGKMTIADGSVVAVSDTSDITGITTKPAPGVPKRDPVKASFSEQDKK